SPLSVFAAAEAPALIALPHLCFELATWSRPKVATDCHVKVAKALYSVPWRLLGRRVDARLGERTVEIFDEGTLVKTHVRIERGRATDWEDYPPHKVAFFMRTPTWCRRRSAELGSSVAELVSVLLEGGALHHLRSAQGVIGLAERHGAERLDLACRRALDVGDPAYRTVRGILAAGTESEGVRHDGTPSAPAHLHGAQSLFAHLSEEAG
ncbi:MAG: Mu transposase domain-containing protein, partial [Acidimicrobiales bacterium]